MAEPMLLRLHDNQPFQDQRTCGISTESADDGSSKEVKRTKWDQWIHKEYSGATTGRDEVVEEMLSQSTCRHSSHNNEEYTSIAVMENIEFVLTVTFTNHWTLLGPMIACESPQTVAISCTSESVNINSKD
eukprot:scaffold130002_cov69-Attheya_sp.AAC.1